mmetsp:Transcript_1038/g.4038  ORF Transcript_1038/g.4038 Transcript_1038/m.4038 type:complete len:142 (-) Transcript_1038:1776-2201(-)
MQCPLARNSQALIPLTLETQPSAWDAGAKTFENVVAPGPGFIKATLRGPFKMAGKVMDLTFESVAVKVGPLPAANLSLTDDSPAKKLLDRLRPKNKAQKEDEAAGKAPRERPNIFVFTFADDDLCIARGSSGNVAVWRRVN